jgi:hypothetical protein
MSARATAEAKFAGFSAKVEAYSLIHLNAGLLALFLFCCAAHA